VVDWRERLVFLVGGQGQRDRLKGMHVCVEDIVLLVARRLAPV